MKIGLDKLKWRGRKYLGGLIHGLAIGCMLGIFLIAKFDFRENVFISSMMMAGMFILISLGHVVLGSPKGGSKTE